MNKKVLFVAYHFPPDAAVGTLRTQKFVKYLPEHGWKPFVLSVQDRYYPTTDPRRLADVDGAVVQRTSFWRTPLQLLIDTRNDLRARKKRNAGDFSAVPKSMSGPDDVRRMSYIKRFLLCLNWLPDDKLYWTLPAISKGLRLIKTNNIRLIVVSAPPNSSIILAYILSQLSGAKLIIDFRDPWLLRHESEEEHIKPKALLNFERCLEMRILRHVSAIITTNEYFHSAFLREYPFINSGAIHVVHNGYDSSDFPLESVKSKNKFIVSYLGSFYMQRNPRIFFQALALFMRDKGLSSNELEVLLIGETDIAGGVPVSEMVDQAGLRDVVKIMGKVSYAHALKQMSESNLLLLLAPNQPYQIPAKTYEYMAAGCPILALAESGATAALIEKTHAGICVAPNDVQGICLALAQFYEDHLCHSLKYATDAKQFERRKQTELLAKILDTYTTEG